MPVFPLAVQDSIRAIHEQFREENAGVVADYIPELGRADPAEFGICVATREGSTYEVGDARVEFTIQSISKALVYGLVLDLTDPHGLPRKVNVEPSGEAFNAISLDPVTGTPSNPMINAGAIATTGQLRELVREKSEEKLLGFFSDLAGRELAINQSVYESERETGHRNRAISHLLRNFDVLELDPELSLDLYFRQCAISVTAHDLAIMAGTLASGGVNPASGVRVLTPETTTKVLAVMGTCGMYDYSGRWLYDVGLPAKSGVGGGVLAVAPGRIGIATYSPRLDEQGNSVRGVKACAEISQQFGLNLFRRNSPINGVVRASYSLDSRASRKIRSVRDRDALETLGKQTQILHVQGVLDFATTERLIASLLQYAGESKGVILDFRSCVDCDAVSGGMLYSQIESVISRGGSILVCHVDVCDELQAHLSVLGSEVVRESLNDALECMEDSHLLGESAAAQPENATPAPIYQFTDSELFQSLNPAQKEAVSKLAKSKTTEPGETVVTAGDIGDEFFVIARGDFGIYAPSKSGSKPVRVATLTAGMTFGEAGLLFREPRTATVISETDGILLCLSESDLSVLADQDPDAVIALMKCFIFSQSEKLRLTDVQVALLDAL